MGGKIKIKKYWDLSILTALKRTRLSFPFIICSFMIVGLLAFNVPREYQSFMFFFFGIPVIYSGLVYSLPVGFSIAVFSFMIHLASSWPFFEVLIKQHSVEELLIEGVFIVIAYLMSCLFITKILLNERENQKKLLKMAGINAQVAQELAKANKEISDIYTNTIQALAAAIDAKDPYTKGHSERVTNYAVAVARELKLAERDVQNILYGAILHDIGKIGINESILRKPGPLTRNEFRDIKKHPEIGAVILSSVPFLEKVVPIVLHHHEFYNGQGYPAGLKGEEIPLGARIISVVDAFDAITTDRPYRSGYSKALAIADLRKGAGIQFDPRIVEILTRVLEYSKEGIGLAEIAVGVDR